MQKWSLLCLALVLCAVRASDAADPNEFIVWSTATLPGRLYVPPTYDPAQQYPLILFLHGAGERGSNNTSQVNVNIDHLFNEAKRRSAFLYAPQLPAGADWTGTPSTPSAAQLRIQLMLAMAQQTYSIDTSRLYLTGLSLGGGGAWDMLGRYEDQFAAGVPICGTGGVSLYRPTLLDQPLWMFHARNDPIVAVTNTRNMMNRILLGRGLPAIAFPPTSDPTHMLYARSPQFYTEYGSGGHASWFAAYQDAAMYDWLFEQRVPEPAALAVIGIGLIGLLRSREDRARRAN